MDSIDLYVRDVGRYATLSWDEQLALFRRRPDPDAERRLVEANLRLVFSTVVKLRRPRDVLEDMIQVGNLALLKAIKGFDIERGFRFSTYLTKTIHSDMWKYHHQNRIINLGVQPHDRSPELNAKADAAASVEFFSDMSETFDCKDPSHEDPCGQLYHKELIDLLKDKSQYFSPRIQQVVEYRMAGLSLRKIGERLGLSKERIRQLLADARRELDCCASA